MKKDIHPDYVTTEVTCTCGNTFTTRSTATTGIIHADVCSNCHPFYTGKQKILDTGGRVARFEARYAKKKAAEAATRAPSSFPDDAGPPLSGAGARRLSAVRRPSRGGAGVRGRRRAGRRARRARGAARRTRDPRRPAAGQQAQPAVRRADRDRHAPGGVAADSATTSRRRASWRPRTRRSPTRPSALDEPQRERPRSGCASCWCRATPTDDKDAILEVKSGEGGEESALFAGDLLRMYTRYAERRGWKTEILDATESDLGGYKSVTVAVKAEGHARARRGAVRACSSSRAACTASSGCRSPSRRAGCTPPPPACW